MIAWAADEDQQKSGIIRIDGQTRKNVGVSLNDLLSIRKIESKRAKSVALLPLGTTNIIVDKEFCEFVKNRLSGFPLVEGDEISVVILGSQMDFQVQKLTPRATVRIEPGTTHNIG